MGEIETELMTGSTHAFIILQIYIFTHFAGRGQGGILVSHFSSSSHIFPLPLFRIDYIYKQTFMA